MVSSSSHHNASLTHREPSVRLHLFVKEIDSITMGSSRIRPPSVPNALFHHAGSLTFCKECVALIDRTKLYCTTLLTPRSTGSCVLCLHTHSGASNAVLQFVYPSHKSVVAGLGNPSRLRCPVLCGYSSDLAQNEHSMVFIQKPETTDPSREHLSERTALLLSGAGVADTRLRLRLFVMSHRDRALWKGPET